MLHSRPFVINKERSLLPMSVPKHVENFLLTRSSESSKSFEVDRDGERPELLVSSDEFGRCVEVGMGLEEDSVAGRGVGDGGGDGWGGSDGAGEEEGSEEFVGGERFDVLGLKRNDEKRRGG